MSIGRDRCLEVMLFVSVELGKGRRVLWLSLSRIIRSPSRTVYIHCWLSTAKERGEAAARKKERNPAQVLLLA